MQFTIKQVANLSGVSTRTLRYYDEIGLFVPAYIAKNGYRMYDASQLEMLDKILCLREFEFSLEDIRAILNSDDCYLLDLLANQELCIAEKIRHYRDLTKKIELLREYLVKRNL